MAGTAAISLKRTPKEGEVAKFRLKAELEFSGQPITFTGLVQEKTVAVTPDSYTVETTQLEGKISMGGNEMDAPGGGVTTTVYEMNNVVKEIRGEMTDGSAYRMAALNGVVMPGKDVAVGDKWSHTFKADSARGSVAASGEFEVLAEEQVGGVDTVKIKATVRETEGAEPASSEGTFWLAKSDGNVVKMEAKWTNAPFPGAPAPISATVTMTREG
jgi:hypothetical protein